MIMGEYRLLFQSMGFLIIIIALAYLAIRYGLRTVYGGINGGRIRVLERVPLDPKSGGALLLVQVDREIYLIGVAQGGVNLLKTYDRDSFQSLETDEGQRPFRLGESFSRVLQGLRKQEPGSPDGDSGRDR